MEDSGKIRQYDSGATRDTAVGKLNYEGFLSPIVLERYAQYLHKHRTQSDGSLRDADNWQKGIPIKTYMEGKTRHGIFTWLLHRGFSAVDDKGNKVGLEDSLCAEIFNAMGYLFELLKEKSKPFVCPARWKIVDAIHNYDCGWYVFNIPANEHLHKDLRLYGSTGYCSESRGEAPGYWPTKEDAEAALVAYLAKEKT